MELNLKHPKPNENYDCNVFCGNYTKIENAFNELEGEIKCHTENEDVHVTADEKQMWDNKSDFSGSYDDLKGKPFGEETVTYLEWDGDVTGLEFNSELGGYKLSDTPLTVEELIGSTVVIKSIVDGSEQNLVVTEDVLTVQGNLITAQIIASLLEDTELMGVTLTKGIWHFAPSTVGSYVSSITKTTVKKIDAKYLPFESGDEVAY